MAGARGSGNRSYSDLVIRLDIFMPGSRPVLVASYLLGQQHLLNSKIKPKKLSEKWLLPLSVIGTSTVTVNIEIIVEEDILMNLVKVPHVTLVNAIFDIQWNVNFSLDTIDVNSAHVNLHTRKTLKFFR